MAHCQYRTRFGNRGFGLGMVLVLSVLIIASALTIAAVSIFQLNAAVQETHGLEAMSVAEGAIAQTLENLHNSIQSQQSPPYGNAGEQVTFPGPPSDPDAPVGQVTFDRTQTLLPFSTYNYNGLTKTGFQNTPVPNGTCHVIATGTSHGITRTLEVLVCVPDFPYALATAGPLNVHGTLEVVNAADMTHAVALAQQGLAGQRLQPASIAAVGPIAVPDPSTCTVTGDVVYAGGAAPVLPSTSALPPLPVVGGHVRNAAVPIPIMPQWSPSGPDVPAVLEPGKIYHHPTDLTLSGPLTLSGNIIYADGDLIVTGGVSGQGALVSSKGITIDGIANLSNVNQVTLSAQQNITLTGNTDFFQGTIYTRGQLIARDITILGTFIGEPGPNAGVQLSGNVTIIRVPPGPGTRTGQDILRTGTGPPQGLPPVQHPGDFYAVTTALPYNASVGLLGAVDTATIPTCESGNPLPSVPPPPECFCCMMGGSPADITRASVDYKKGQGGPASGVGFYNAITFGASDTLWVDDLYYDSIHNRTVMLSPDVVNATNGSNPESLSTLLANVVAESIKGDGGRVANQSQGGLVPDNTNIVQIIIDYLRYRQQQACNMANSILQPFPPQITPFTPLNPNPDSFLPDAPPLSIVSWREK